MKLVNISVTCENRPVDAEVSLYPGRQAIVDGPLIRPFLLCFTEIAGVSVPSETVSQWNPQRRQETALPIRETDEPNSLYLGPSAGGETYRAPQSSRKGPFRRSCREKHCSCGLRGGGSSLLRTR